jgi:hypothetical protein
MTNDRLLLWVDGVGGYLVCLGKKIALGRAQPGNRVDIPLLAEVSRLHAELHRDEEGYVIEARKPVRVNNKPAGESASLRDGDRITVGSALQFVFRLPVPVSGSARLEIASGHRLGMAVDAVLLMADTLVLGPGTQTHIQAADMRRQVVLHRSKAGLAVRCPGEFQVNDGPCTNRAELNVPARVCADDVVFTLEVAT